MRYDAIIIGAGPAGSCSAILLAKAGWSVAVVEKSRFPRRKVCGEFISVSNKLLLVELGIADVYDELAGPEIRRIGAFAREAAVAAEVPHGTVSGGGWGRALGREKLDAILLDEGIRKGAHLWQPWSAVGLERGAGIFSCTIAGKLGEERTLIAPVIIAAHGSWERGSLPTQADRPHRASDLLAFKAHFRNCGLPSDLMPLIAFPGGYGGLVTSDSGRVSLSCCIRRDALRECRARHPAAAAEAVLRHIAESCTALRDALRHAHLEDRWLAAGPINPGIRGGISGGVFLAGNAAGEAHPIVAEGISIAMQSASLLCSELVARHDEARTQEWLCELGRHYSTKWRSRFATRIRAAAVFAHLAMRPTPVEVLLPVVRAFPGLLTFGAVLSGKRKLHAELGVAASLPSRSLQGAVGPGNRSA